MIEKTICQASGAIAGKKGRTIEQARSYEDKFVVGKRRNRILNNFEKAFARRVFEMVGDNSHIVDIPCGSGRFFEIFSKARKLTMADYSGNMLKVCEERFGNLENVKLIQADVASIPLSDDSAELCFCMRLFHHLDSDQLRLGALKELTRISCRYVAISFYNKNCSRFYWRKTLGKKNRGHYVAFEHFIDLAKRMGLELVERFPKVNLIEQQCLVIFRKV